MIVLLIFNSQICTSLEQSERLLKLGLKSETADMTWEFSHTMDGIPQYDCRAESSWDSETFARYVDHCEKIGYFEHWKHEDGSQMTPEEVYAEIMEPHIPAWSLHRLIEMYIARYLACSVNIKDLTYEWIINEIEIHIKEGDFNKEYLCDGK